MNFPIKGPYIRRLFNLTGAAFVFWGLSASAHLDAAPLQLTEATMPQRTRPVVVHASFEEPIVHILSSRDAVLYRAAFAAQKKGDIAFADSALEQIGDKRLKGHLLADRYMHEGVGIEEAKVWFASYAHLPQAKDLYEKVQNLKGFSSASIKNPNSVNEWQGNNGFSATLPFPSVKAKGSELPKNALGRGFNRALRRGSPEEALRLLSAALNRGDFSITLAGEPYSRIAAAFFYEGETGRARALARKAAETNIPLGLWIEGLAAWKQKDYDNAEESFGRLSKLPELSSWNQATAAYWAYRAADRLGHTQKAQSFLAKAARYPRSFYGAMAAHLTGQDPDRSWQAPELTDKAIALLASKPSGWRALALTQIGRTDLAERELRHLLSLDPSPVQKAALALAEKARMPSLALQLSSVTFRRNGKPFDAALYPLPPWKPTGGFTVDRALIYAIMRHESQFDPNAVSFRGACGLMQIMPSTARHIAKKPFSSCRSASTDESRLFDPALNMDMGQRYVRILSDRRAIGNNLLLLLAAYNGGPGNLSRWLSTRDSTDPLFFIESLPVRETRDYVQQVMVHYWMYRTRLYGSDKTVTTLANGEWPHYVLNDTLPENTQSAALESLLSMASVEPSDLKSAQ
ncbi:MAG: lytic transglycosylase domain-containing protein [Alphaproteobacteria bacterium]|nr:lytic transglycosylase domain-containing protein [Alphaproteobacteria bacterium]